MGLFGMASQDLELRVQTLEQLVGALMDLVEPSIVIQRVDPWSGWAHVSRDGPDGIRRYGYGDSIRSAINDLLRVESFAKGA